MSGARLWLIYAALLAATVAHGEPSPHAAVHEGNEMYRAGRYPEAIARYDEAAKTMPGAPQIDFDRGDVYYQQVDLNKALEHFSRALATADPILASRIKYNLGNIKYQQALNAMLTFRDAASHLRTAISYYRDSLALDPNQPDTRYNLELGLKLMQEINAQIVVQQPNAGLRDQKSSDNKGQAHDESSEEHPSETPAADDQPKQGDQAPQNARSQQQAPPQNASTQNSAQNQSNSRMDLNPDEAQHMVDVLRERARTAEQQRQQGRLNRMRDVEAEKFW